MRKAISIFIVMFYLLTTCCTPIHFAKAYEFNDILGLEFETERLILTPTSEDDLEILSSYLLDNDVTKYLDPTTKNGFKTQKEALSFLKSKAECDKAIELTIKLKDGKIPIGKLDAMLTDHLVSFGYFIGKDFQGKGYASEACYTVCNKVFNAQNIRTVYIACDSRNISSARLAIKILSYLKENNPHLELDDIYQRTMCIEGTPMKDFALRKSRV